MARRTRQKRKTMEQEEEKSEVLSGVFPCDIMLDILSRLPVKSLQRLRCVSTSWHKLVSNPYFANMHLNRQTTENTHCKLILLIESKFHMMDYEESSQAVEIPNQSVFSGGVWGTCNGLIYIRLTGYILYLWNPVTGEHRVIPQPPMLCSDYNREEFSYGFGYNHNVNDYEAVRIAAHFDHVDGHYSVVDVYSLAKNSWRRIPNVPYWIDSSKQGELVNGCLHWLASKLLGEPYVVMAFDIGGETFREVSCPQVDYDDDNLMVSELGGQLSLFCSYFGQMEAWVMKEYGVKESWTKLCVINNDFFQSVPKPLCFTMIYNDFFQPAPEPLCFTKKGALLMLFKKKLVRYFPVGEVKIDGNPNVIEARTYRESLVGLGGVTN